MAMNINPTNSDEREAEMLAVRESLQEKRNEMIALREKYERNISQMTPAQKKQYAQALKNLKAKLENSLSDYASSFVKDSVFLNDEIAMAFISLHGEDFSHNTARLCIAQDWEGLDRYLQKMRDAIISLSFNFQLSEYEKAAVVA